MKKNTLSSFLIALLAFIFVGSSVPVPSYGSPAKSDKEYKLKLSHIFAEGHPQTIAMESFAERVSAYSNGSITVDLFPNSAIGGEEQSVEGLKSGTLEMAVIGTLMQSEVPNLGIMQLPFLFKGYAQAEQVMRGEMAWEIIRKLEEFNVKPLAVTTQGFRQIIGNRPIASMNDLKGFRLRTANYRNMIMMGEALGCTVNAMSLSEVFSALQTKVIDGLENSYMALRTGGYHEILHYLLESNHVFTPNIICISKNLYENMSQAQQEALQKAAAEAAEYQWRLAKQQDEKDKKILEDSGINIIYPDTEFHNRMMEATQIVYRELYKISPEAENIVKRIQEMD